MKKKKKKKVKILSKILKLIINRMILNSMTIFSGISINKKQSKKKAKIIKLNFKINIQLQIK